MRRLASLLGILAILALVLLLFWRVYEHHEQSSPYGADETVASHVKITTDSF